MKPRVLIVDDEQSFCVSMARFLTRSGFLVDEANTLSAARHALASGRYDGMLLDLNLPDGNGLDWIEDVRRAAPDVSLVVITGCGDIPIAVEAMRRGADHFVTKPIDPSEVTSYLHRMIEGRQRKSRSSHRNANADEPFFGRGSVAQVMRSTAESAARSDAVVLITGETGSGKGVLARWIHEQSSRSSKAFVEVNCSALRGEMLANEMFGHARGAFTSASDAQPGLLDAADGGTLFLDEIGDMDLLVQAQLLKTIEEKRYRRLGEVTTRRSDFRLICATNHSLDAAVANGRFRSDLFYRINMLTIRVPSLRERAGDIRGFIEHLSSAPIDSAAVDVLERHHWPGNIRELRNVLERAALFADGEAIGPRHLDLGYGRATPVDDDVLAALQRNGGDKRRAAQDLGISRATLYRRIRSSHLVSRETGD